MKVELTQEEIDVIVAGLEQGIALIESWEGNDETDEKHVRFLNHLIEKLQGLDQIKDE